MKNIIKKSQNKVSVLMLNPADPDTICNNLISLDTAAVHLPAGWTQIKEERRGCLLKKWALTLKPTAEPQKDLLGVYETNIKQHLPLASVDSVVLNLFCDAIKTVKDAGTANHRALMCKKSLETVRDVDPERHFLEPLEKLCEKINHLCAIKSGPEDFGNLLGLACDNYKTAGSVPEEEV